MSEPSKTAVATLAHRALHQTIDPERLYDDDVALRLFAGVALARAAERFTAGGESSKRLRDHVVRRTIFAEERLRRAVVERGVAQYVVLGAGYDTFASGRPVGADDEADAALL